MASRLDPPWYSQSYWRSNTPPCTAGARVEFKKGTLFLLYAMISIAYISNIILFSLMSLFSYAFKWGAVQV